MVKENVGMVCLYNLYVSKLFYWQSLKIAWNGNYLLNEDKEKIKSRRRKEQEGEENNCCQDKN